MGVLSKVMVDDHLSQKGHAHLASAYALMTGGPVLAGPEIAEYGGLTDGRAAAALNRLHGLGVVHKGSPEELGWARAGGSGRPPGSAYCLSNSWGYAVGVAAGQRQIGTGLIDARGEFSERRSTEPECRVDEAVTVADQYWQTLQTIVQQILECVRRRRAQLDALGLDTPVEVRGITVAVPGQISGIRQLDPKLRRVATILEKFRRKPVGEDLADLLARNDDDLEFDPRMIPIWLENDADCAAVGELHWGNGIGCQSLLVVKVSAGVGAGIIINGRIHYGHEATAGEIGHDPVHPALREHLNKARPRGLEPLRPASELLRCSCLLAESNHLEAYASATAVTCRVLGRPPADIPAAEWRDALKAVIDAAIVGEDEKAQHAIRDAGFLLGQRIKTLAAALGFERILVIGSLADAQELLLGAIHDQIEEMPAPGTLESRHVTFGMRGDAARWIGVNGAAWLALEHAIWGPPRMVGRYEWPGHEVAETMVREARAAKRGMND
jgi:predicted NBD/HSP70 family sugar kinase